MKVSAIFVLLAAMLVAVCASPFNGRPSLPRPSPGNPGFPNFPGHAAFNPRPWGRHRRSPGGRVVVDQPVDGRGSVSVDMDHKIYEGEHGSVRVYGGGHVEDGGQPQGRAGVRGEFHWD